MPGKEPRLGDAEKETQYVEGLPPGDEDHHSGDDPPADHDAGDPDPGPGAQKDDVAWDFEEEIAEEKYAGSPAIDIITEAEILVHLKRSKADIGPVYVRDEVDSRR